MHIRRSRETVGLPFPNRFWLPRRFLGEGESLVFIVFVGPGDERKLALDRPKVTGILSRITGPGWTRANGTRGLAPTSILKALNVPIGGRLAVKMAWVPLGRKPSGLPVPWAVTVRG